MLPPADESTSCLSAVTFKLSSLIKRCKPAAQKNCTQPLPAIVIHAGAGNILKQKMTPEEEKQLRAGLIQATEQGYAVLLKGGSAADAVEVAVRTLEDNPLFNAGKGAVFNRDGINQLEASIMDGSSNAAGAATLLTVVKNPISLARKVMESNFHVFLCGPGAERYAKEQGLDIVDPSYFWTKHRWEQHERGYLHAADLPRDKCSSNSNSDLSDACTQFVSSEDDVSVDYSHFPMGTVGAVAVDMNGYLAAATSTGGMSNKWDGRIGDSPIIGAGTFADKNVAVSSTGSGEYFIRQATARYIALRVRLLGELPAQASKTAMVEMKASGGEGGVICIDSEGSLSISFCSAGMYRGYCSERTGNVPVVGIFGDEIITPGDNHIE